MTPERWTQIEELFHRVVECEPAQRSTLLEQACNGDLALRREVEALLSSDAAAAESMQAAVHLELSIFAFPLVDRIVGHYRILSGLDGGGMGLVYRAEDIKLGRQVALKFLPEESVKDPGALSRFEREARAASALEHPNICPIYEFGEHDGQPFLVMPLLQGQTLKQLISSASDHNAALPLDKLLAIAIQITEGLEAAHRRGFIHRDIKPANIFITDQGQAKILDFGLAKIAGADACAPDSIAAGESAVDAITNPFPSRPGIAIGTAGYMSPEQVRGEKLNARTDLFSFGLVLFEMITGKRAFPGDSGPEVQSAILSQSPPSLRQLNSRFPAALERIVTKALQKDCAARYQAASEIRADLESLQQHLAPTRAARWFALTSLGILIFGVGVIFWFIKRQPPAASAQPEFRLRQLTANSSENHVLGGAISPDGKYLAYIDLRGLYIKRLDTGDTQALTSPGQNIDLNGHPLEAENDNPLWLPDGRKFLVNIGSKEKSFAEMDLSDSSIWEVLVPSGAMRKLRGGAFAWSISFDGSSVAFASNMGRLGPREVWLMGPNGENARKLDEVDNNHAIGPFSWSADGRRLTYVSTDDSGDTMMSRDLLGHPPIVIFPNSELGKMPGMLMLADGREIFSIKEPGFADDTCNFWSARLDPETLKPVEKLTRLTNWTGFCMDATSSTSDGKNIAFKKWTTHTAIYVADLGPRGARIIKPRHFVLDELATSFADWTPDGQLLIFFSLRNGQPGVFKQRVDQDTAELVASGPGRFSNGQVTPDGAWVLWQVAAGTDDRSKSSQLVRAPIAGGSVQTVAELAPSASISCARPPSSLCVLAERSGNHQQVLVSKLDPSHGRGEEVFRFSIDPTGDWNGRISPDGTQFAVIDGPAQPIQVFSLRGASPLTVPIPTLKTKQVLRWAPDGKSFFITAGIKGGEQLLHVDWHGHATVLWENNNDVFPVGLPSPDGKHLAIQSSSEENNIWLLENF